MAGFNLSPPPRTSDPRRISNYLSEQYEYLSYMFRSLDSENLSDEVLDVINNLQNKVATLEEKVNNLSAAIGDTNNTE